jgi:galactokinase
VLDAVAALRAGDGPRLGSLCLASHRSMRDDYETSTPEIDRLVDIACRHERIQGARLTGGGFGGAVVIIAVAGEELETAREICNEYQRCTGQQGRVLVPMSA